MTSIPLVSVVIPVFNRELLLSDAIESVLRQDYSPLEIIVVDDGSTDGTATVAKGFGGSIRYAYQQNAGPAGAKNRGLELANGNLIGFLDSDDMWAEGSLDILLSCLAENPQADVVLGYTQILKQSPVTGDLPVFKPIDDPQPYYHFGNALFRRSAFDKVGMFDAKMRFKEDSDWFLRALHISLPMIRTKQITLNRRLHQYNMTNGPEAETRDLVRFVKNYLDRRRGKT